MQCVDLSVSERNPVFLVGHFTIVFYLYVVIFQYKRYVIKYIKTAQDIF
jgi:hypothetical protein